MPVILEVDEINLERPDMDKRVPPNWGAKQTRKPGLHQSDVLTYIARKLKILQPNELLEEDYPLIWAYGQMWEEFCVSLYPEIEWQPPQALKNGIWRSPDGISQGTDGPMLEEFKFTYKRLRTPEEFLEEWLYMHQGRGYLSSYGCTVMRWHVTYVQGDYKKFGPVYRRYVIQFSKSEIEQTEKMLCANKTSAENAICQTHV